MFARLTNNVLRPTACVTCGGWEGRLPVEMGKTQSQKHAKNAVRTHRQVHALLGALIERQTRELEQASTD